MDFLFNLIQDLWKHEIDIPLIGLVLKIFASMSIIAGFGHLIYSLLSPFLPNTKLDLYGLISFPASLLFAYLIISNLEILAFIFGVFIFILIPFQYGQDIMDIVDWFSDPDWSVVLDFFITIFWILVFVVLIYIATIYPFFISVLIAIIIWKIKKFLKNI